MAARKSKATKAGNVVIATNVVKAKRRRRRKTTKEDAPSSKTVAKARKRKKSVPERFYVELPKGQVVRDGQMHLVFGFDISSTTTGITLLCIYDGYIHHAECSYYKPIKKDMSQIETLVQLRTDISDMLEKMLIRGIKITNEISGYCGREVHIGVEDFLMFVPNRSSAGTVTTLAIFNRTTCLTAFDMLNVLPELFPVMTIRSVLRKLSGTGQKVDKEDVPSTCEKIIAERHISGTWKFLWLTGRNGVVEENFDMGDSIAAALACAFHNHLIA